MPKINFDCLIDDSLFVNLIFELVISKNVAELCKGMMVTSNSLHMHNQGL